MNEKQRARELKLRRENKSLLHVDPVVAERAMHWSAAAAHITGGDRTK